MARGNKKNTATESTVTADDQNVNSNEVAATDESTVKATGITESAVPFDTADESVLTYESAAALLGVNPAYMRALAKKSDSALQMESRKIPGTNYRVIVVTRESLDAYMAQRGAKRGRKPGVRMYNVGPINEDQAQMLTDLARQFITDLHPDFRIDYRQIKKSGTLTAETAESGAAHEVDGDNAADLIAEMDAAESPAFEHEHEA